jgi:oxygen-independent coproporphyrinogen-3 oxidase
VRWWNAKHPATYAQRIRAGQSPAVGREVLDDVTRAVEDTMLRVRMAEGIALADLSDPQRAEVPGLVADGLATVVADRLATVDADGGMTGGRLVLTRPGRLLADAVVRRLVA